MRIFLLLTFLLIFGVSRAQDGFLDTSLGGQGIVPLPGNLTTDTQYLTLTSNNIFAVTLSHQSSGAGTTTFVTLFNFVPQQWGAPRSLFNFPANQNARLVAATVDRQGRAVLVWQFQSADPGFPGPRYFVARYTDTFLSALDSSFDGDGQFFGNFALGGTADATVSATIRRAVAGPDGSILLLGQCSCTRYSNGNQPLRAMIFRIEPDGAAVLKSALTFMPPLDSAPDADAFAAAFDRQGNFLLAGTQRLTNGELESAMYALTPNLDGRNIFLGGSQSLLFEAATGGNEDDVIYDVAFHPETDVWYVAGSAETAPQSYTAFVARQNPGCTGGSCTAYIKRYNLRANSLAGTGLRQLGRGLHLTWDYTARRLLLGGNGGYFESNGAAVDVGSILALDATGLLNPDANDGEPDAGFGCGSGLFGCRVGRVDLIEGEIRAQQFDFRGRLMVFGKNGAQPALARARYATRAINEVPGATPGAIPDNQFFNPRIMRFLVNGLTQKIGRMRVRLDMAHPRIGDLVVRLVGPNNGTPVITLFGAVGATVSSGFGAAGNAAAMSGVFTFDDRGESIWSYPASLPAGKRFRASLAGGSPAGGISSSLVGVFGDATAAEMNGLWTLFVSDRLGADVGRINGAALEFVELTDGLFEERFELPALGPGRRVKLDFFGKGSSDYVVTRPLPNNNYRWYIGFNNLSASIGFSEIDFGSANQGSTSLSAGDFDGDGFWDIAQWVSAQGILYYNASSDQRQRTIGHPSLVGGAIVPSSDLDGDGRFELAVRVGNELRVAYSGQRFARVQNIDCGFAACEGLGQGANGEPLVALRTNGGDFSNLSWQNLLTGASVIDLQPGGAGALRSLGNHLGDANPDLVMVRADAGNWRWDGRDYANPASFLSCGFWGFTTDILLTGDYDGDGRDDCAVWRPGPNANPQAFFFVRRSGGGDLTVAFGQRGDAVPASAWIRP